MPYNHGLELKKFEAQQRRLRQQYEQAGLTEDEIQAMYQFDFDVFNSERRYQEHTLEHLVNFDSLVGSTDENHPRLWWVEEIDDPVLAKRLKTLRESDLELLTLYAIDGFSQTEIAALLDVTKQAVSKRICALKTIAKYF